VCVQYETNYYSNHQTIEPNCHWGTDMTKIMIPDFGWAYLHVVIDWGSKKLLSCKLSTRSKTTDWLDALNEAINVQFPQGIKKIDFFLPYSVMSPLTNGCITK
jgi:putative transposase